MLIVDRDRALPDTTEVRVQLDLVKQLRGQHEEAEADLDSMVEEIRTSCEHVFENETKLDTDYCSRVNGKGRGQETVFTGKKCIRCGLIEPRKNGHPWEVCHKCGNDMPQGHREVHGEDQMIEVHRCPSCGHIYQRMVG